MAELANLSHDEKVFLAGCIRTIILADGALQSSELDDVDRIYTPGSVSMTMKPA